MQSCGIPIESTDVIRLGHGSGGKLTEQLVEQIFIPRIGNPILNALDDAALLQIGGSKLAFSTDSYVVKPLFFPGGDIGSLSVHGTINDLSMRMAEPLYLSAAFIIEEGFSIAELEKIVDSFAVAAREANVQVVAADTKVVNRGAGDGVYINTTGIGIIKVINPPSANKAKPGDSVIVSGDLGRHGISVLCLREGLDLETELQSDCASLNNLVLSLTPFENSLHCMRDLTRGGLSSALNEIAHASNVGIIINDSQIAINPAVKGACELLGLDPLYVACEGRFVCIVDSTIADRVVEALRINKLGCDAAIIGSVTTEHPGRVVSKTSIGGRRIVDKLSGDQLPRIC
ncbi:MAG: hydrogenase expression/formation protein HypE [Candidatus Melainabacteria bacterium]|nr:hydrogenase expression/formation protein HypE [Candidatus Melainabacteria bacterium]